MHQPRSLRLARPVEPDRRNTSLFPRLYVKSDADELVLVINLRFSVNFGLKVSVLMEEVQQHVLSDWKARWIIGIFILKIEYPPFVRPPDRAVPNYGEGLRSGKWHSHSALHTLLEAPLEPVARSTTLH